MSFGRRALRSPAFVAGAILFSLIAAAAILAPVIAPYSPSAQNLTGGLLPPSPEHWFGTDQLGRDVLSRMLFAAQTDLRIAVLAALAPFVIGVTAGLVTGYFGGAVDWAGSRITDTVIAFPFYVIVIAIVFAVGAGEGGIVLAFALVGWTGYARVLRAMTASLRHAGWVQAARGGGLSHARVLLRHLLPNVLPQALVLLAGEIVLIMVAIVTLGYLGLGIQPPTPDWGTMISDGQLLITTHWWLSALPGLAVVATGIALSLLGDGVGDALRVGAAPRRGRGARGRRVLDRGSRVRVRSGSRVRDRGRARVRDRRRAPGSPSPSESHSDAIDCTEKCTKPPADDTFPYTRSVAAGAEGAGAGVAGAGARVADAWDGAAPDGAVSDGGVRVRGLRVVRTAHPSVDLRNMPLKTSARAALSASEALGAPAEVVGAPAETAPAEPTAPVEPAAPTQAAALAPAGSAAAPADLVEAPGVLVHDLSFEVRPGEALGIVGESGSGKSLTLRALLGMMPSGTAIAGGGIAVGGRVGMVFQDPLTALDPLTRVGVQLREAVEAAGGRGARSRARRSPTDRAERTRGTGADPGAGAAAGAATDRATDRATGRTPGRARAAERVLELLEQVRLPDPERIARSYPHQLSGGQRQRVVIAMALAGDPAVLLCDEPTTALDVTVQGQVLALLDELRRTRGITLVFVSHDLAVVASMCRRVLVMRAGREVESGETAGVIRDPRSPYTRALLEAVPILPPLAEPDPEPVSAAAPAPAPAPTSAPDVAVSTPRFALWAAAVAAPVEQPDAPRPWCSPASSTGGTGDFEKAPDPTLAPASAPLLEARGVAVRYGGFVGVEGVSFAVAGGGSLGVVGESGSGKTTLARALAGQLRQSEGEILLGGRPLGSPRTRAERRAIQLVPQDPYSSLDPRMTVGQTLGELIGGDRAGKRARIAELLRSVSLDPGLAHAHPHALSGGQRQRVAIARALAADPRVIVADEPTSALDVSVQAEVIALLRRLRDELGLGLVLISHDLAVVHELCDEAVVLRGGRVVEQGAGVLTAPCEAYTRELLEAVPRLPVA